MARRRLYTDREMIQLPDYLDLFFLRSPIESNHSSLHTQRRFHQHVHMKSTLSYQEFLMAGTHYGFLLGIER